MKQFKVAFYVREIVDGKGSDHHAEMDWKQIIIPIDPRVPFAKPAYDDPKIRAAHVNAYANELAEGAGHLLRHHIAGIIAEACKEGK